MKEVTFTQSLETGYFLEIGIWDGNWIVGMRKLDRIVFCSMGVIKANAFRV
jgi:hypothetical protein